MNIFILYCIKCHKSQVRNIEGVGNLVTSEIDRQTDILKSIQLQTLFARNGERFDTALFI